MQVSPEQPTYSEAPLQLLLFVDERPSSRQQNQQIHNYLQELQADYPFELQIIDVGKQPYLAEHFKLVATPALIKIHPAPRHTLAGGDLIAQLQNWWSRWQSSVAAHLQLIKDLPEQTTNAHLSPPKSAIRSVADSAELIRLADEIFHLKREQEKLLEQLQFKDRVIAMLAHDLRNPLTAVSIAVETLESNLVPEPGKDSRLTPRLTSQLFKQARNQTRTIDRMITGILQVGRGSNGDLQIQPQKVELGTLCRDMIEHLRDRASTKAQNLETDIPNDLPDVCADIERVQQVLTNLLDNAIKYTPNQGTIRISCLHRTSQKVQVSVCDTGPGIPVENRDRIFEDRYRLERDEAKDGYGIGLALCQRIIRAHYGQIWVDSALNSGACFHFTLPVYSMKI